MAKQTGHLLRQLRSLMRSKHLLSEAIQAYIIPSEDAHQVNCSKLKFKDALFIILGTLWNYDGDGKENVKKATGLMSKTITLRVHHAFSYISLLSLCNYNVKWPSFKFTWERERQGIKF